MTVRIRVDLRTASAAVLVRPSRADQMLEAAALSQPDVNFIEVGVIAKTEPQAVEPIPSLSAARSAVDGEISGAEVAEPFHL